MRCLPVFLLLACSLSAQPRYDLLIKGGHVIDPKNNIDRVTDVAVAQGKIARVADNIPSAEATKTVDASNLYVTPGLIDIHAHVYVWKEAGGEGVQPDAFSFRTGVTTLVDAGSSGANSFNDFRDRIIKRAKTRVLAFLNISAAGMGTGKEDDLNQLDSAAAAAVSKANPDIIVGYKSAHYAGPAWESVDAAVKAGDITKQPVMIDFGRITETRNLNALLLDKLRPGDIYTHCYSGHRQELMDDNTVNPAMIAGRKRGIIFDLGHGAASFYWYVAIPAFKQGFVPDSISTDLHQGSMNAGMMDMTATMTKVLNLGTSITDVIRMSTWNPAKEIRRPQLGNLDPGADADIAILRLEHGKFGMVDSAGARKPASQRIVAALSVRAGKVVWDPDGLAAPAWENFSYQKHTWMRQK